MNLSSVETLNIFNNLATDGYDNDELDLERFIEKFIDRHHTRVTGSKYLNVINVIINSIKFPDKFILGPHELSQFGIFHIANHLQYFDFDKTSFDQAELMEGKDYANIEFPIIGFHYATPHSRDRNGNIIPTEYHKKDTNYKTQQILLSFNGLKKFVKYLHSRAIMINTNAEALEHALDFEIVYKKTKEGHANSRKAYLAELARVNNHEQEPLRSEIPFAIKLYENKFQEVTESKPQAESKPSSVQNGMIIYKRHSGRSKTIISKNIEDELESIMEDLETISISHFDVFTGEADDSDIIVIESINKKDILKAMKLYK